MKNRKPLIVGLIGSMSLIAVYFGVVSITGSFSHAITELASIWYWIVLLAAGFGTQLGLFTYMRASIKNTAATVEVATSGGVSAGAMVACCAHHIAELLPILGVSAAALFLAKYQLPFILVGLFSNLIGIAIIISVMQKHGIYPRNRFYERLLKINIRSLRSAIITLSVAVVAFSFLLTALRSDADSSETTQMDFPIAMNDENAITFEARPLAIEFDKPLRIELSIDTHVGALDFDVTDVAVLETDTKTVLEPLSWEGSPPGGHHRSGTLTFPSIPKTTKELRLIIRNVYEIETRTLSWSLQ